MFKYEKGKNVNIVTLKSFVIHGNNVFIWEDARRKG